MTSSEGIRKPTDADRILSWKISCLSFATRRIEDSLFSLSLDLLVKPRIHYSSCTKEISFGYFFHSDGTQQSPTTNESIIRNVLICFRLCSLSSPFLMNRLFVFIPESFQIS